MSKVAPGSYLAEVTKQTQILEFNAGLRKLMLIYGGKHKKPSHFKLIALVREMMEILKIDVCASRMITCAAYTENIKV